MPKFQIPTRHRWLVQLCTLAAFVVSLAWGQRASAAVPMCGVHAQTVVAPPIGTPASNDAVTPVPCDPLAPLRQAGVPQRDAPEKMSFPEAPIRALPVLPRLAFFPILSRRSPAGVEQALPRAGFASSIDRPPRN